MSNTSGYRDVESDYFEKQRLRPYAKSIHLWALGVGAVFKTYGRNYSTTKGSVA